MGDVITDGCLFPDRDAHEPERLLNGLSETTLPMEVT